MRREKFELSISPPAVLFKQCEETGKRLEPIEELVCEVEEEHTGGVIEAVVTLERVRSTDMQMGAGEGGRTRLDVHVAPSRGLIGFRQVFINETRGTGTITRAFHGYEKYRGPMDRVRKGAIVSSSATGSTTHVRARSARSARIAVRGSQDGGVRGDDHRREQQGGDHRG